MKKTVKNLTGFLNNNKTSDSEETKTCWSELVNLKSGDSKMDERVKLYRQKYVDIIENFTPELARTINCHEHKQVDECVEEEEDENKECEEDGSIVEDTRDCIEKIFGRVKFNEDKTDNDFGKLTRAGR